MGRRNSINYKRNYGNNKPLNHLDMIDKARQEFINQMLQSYKHKLEYLGQADTNDIEFPDALPQPTGDEETIENHSFRMIKIGTLIMARWRVYTNI
jgi:hypothetical protein